VLAVRLNRKRLVIVLEDQIYLYDIQTMKLLYTIETSPNPSGKATGSPASNYPSNYLLLILASAAICALAPSSENCYLAYPLPQKAPPSSFAPPSHAPPANTHVSPTSGEVLIFDAQKLEAINVVEAHKSPLSCIALNSEGTLLATASDKGTIIRVFSVPDGKKLYQFRRGSMPSRIFSMSFNTASTLLCVSSATETVHIFKLEQQGAPSSPSPSPSKERHPSLDSSAPDESAIEGGTDFSSRKHNGTLMGMLRRTSQSVGNSFAATVGGYLPKGVTEMWEPTRDFAWIKIPRPTKAAGTNPGPMRSVVAMSSNTPEVMVVTSDGSFFLFGIDLFKGGEGTLMKQYSYV
jgi:autophagy-related protein 18